MLDTEYIEFLGGEICALLGLVMIMGGISRAAGSAPPQWHGPDEHISTLDIC